MKKLKVIMAVMSMVLAALMAFTACGGSPETITFEAPVRLAVTAQSSSGSSGFSTLSETESASETWLLNESLDFSRFNIIEDITYLYVYQYKGRGDTANEDRSDFRYFRAKNGSCSVS